MKRKSLGSWFPSASVIKAAKYDPEAKISIALFYQYIQPLWSEIRKNEAMSYVEKHAMELNIGGRLRISREGINATITGEKENVQQFCTKLQEFDPHFLETDFKYIDNMPLDRAFKDMKVLPVKELVFYGIDSTRDLGEGGVHLPATEYHKKLAEPNTVVIDVRNTYESDIGNFSGQHQVNGAELIVPDMRKSTDFPDWLSRSDTKEKLAGKNVLMYCTGGVRCERASQLLKHEFGHRVNGVYQLQGGIEKYLQEFPDGGFWQGKNFVFDKREAFSAGDSEGVGGVLRPSDIPITSSSVEKKEPTAEVSEKSSKKKKKKQKKENSDHASKVVILGKCCVCSVPWDRYIGKKKCYTCGVPVLLCESCCTKQVDKIEETKSSMRCPLCVTEGITTPASALTFTNNGKQATIASETVSSKAAKTVCKWGGGHARDKHKEKTNRKMIEKVGAKPCKFGAACTRADCWFSH